MKDILQEIVAHKRVELVQLKQEKPFEDLCRESERVVRKCRSMKEALASSSSGIIAEFKRRSPSKGWIHESLQPEDVVPNYSESGASALSILTDRDYFGGSLEFITRMRPLVDRPILRKDFIIDEYQLHEARLCGADAVLLIAACLSVDECRNLALKAHELGLETLLEIHGENELEYCDLPVDMIGVNNRNLGTFVTDVNHSFSLASKLPSDMVLVSESGLSSPAVVRELRDAGYRGFLIGETFMKEESPAVALEHFIKEVTLN